MERGEMVDRYGRKHGDQLVSMNGCIWDHMNIVEHVFV